MASALLGDWSRADRWSKLTRQYLPAAMAYMVVPEYHLFECLVIARERWPSALEAARAELLASCREQLEKLRSFALACPANHEHLFALASAEVARLADEPMDRVLGSYERAARATGDSFIFMRALACELQSHYLREKGCDGLADTALQQAASLYAHWGAAAKVKRLAQQQPKLFAKARLDASSKVLAPSTVTRSRLPFDEAVGASSLDMDSVLKATQAISGEVRPERLFARLMDAIVENAGAERACLVMVDEGSGQPVVCARSEAGQSESCAPTAPEEPSHRVCLAALRYVMRSQSELCIDDAGVHPQFAREAYVQANGVKSVLSVPVLQQGRLVAVLYLENNATTHAFTQSRVEALRVIAGQAAVSIANARLYATLEQRVDDRTRALSAKTRKIEAMLHGMHQGVFTIDADLRVQPEYSEHLPLLLGQSDIVGRRVDELLFDGAGVAPDARQRTESALFFAFGGPPSIADVNAAHLIREFTRRASDETERVFEVDWNFISGESHVVDSVLVTLRDVTVVRSLAERVAQAEREATLIAQILDVGLAKFGTFCSATRDKLAEAAERLSGAGMPSAREAEAAFRALHTIKGNAGMLGLTDIVAATHAAEDACRPLREHASSEQHAAAKSALGTLAQLVAAHEELAARKLGSLRAAGDPRQVQALAAIEGILAQAPEAAAHPLQVLSELRAVVADLRSIALQQVVEDAADKLPSLADELGKAAPELQCESGGLRLTPAWAALLRDALVHLFRNSLDHGLEPRAERAAAGKSARGQLRVWAEARDHAVLIRVSDDGRGLALDRLREKAEGQPCSDDELAELIFAFGVSTAASVSTISGRGVGMDAVRSDLRRHGGDASVEFTGPRRDGHRPIALLLKLPDAALVASRHFSRSGETAPARA